jgi:Ras-related GTP-binding protein A/B
MVSLRARSLPPPQAWSKIIHTLIPNVEDLERKLDQFAELNSATEVVIFERTTFLVIAKNQQKSSSTLSDSQRQAILLEEEGYPPLSNKVAPSAKSSADVVALYPGRFGKISQMIKALRHACS